MDAKSLVIAAAGKMALARVPGGQIREGEAKEQKDPK